MSARPATTSRTAETAAPMRPRVRDFSGAGATIAIEFDVRTAYDFVFSLSDDAGSTDDLPADDRRWLAEARASLPDDIRADLESLFANELCISVAGVAVDRPDARDSAGFVAALEATDPATILRLGFHDALADPAQRPLIERAIEGDTAALGEAEAVLPDWRRTERLAILREPGRTHATVVRVLKAWADRFASIEERVGAILRRDLEGRAADRAVYRGTELIERTTGGIRWLSEGGVRRVILAPSYFSRPYNFLLAGDDWRFFGYPVADSALGATDPLAPPPAVVRLHRALGDETRLRILKLLAAKDLYLTEIAQQLELSKPTIKHHLALLRAAGLVTVTEEGAVIYYSLRRDRVEGAAGDLVQFLIS